MTRRSLQVTSHGHIHIYPPKCHNPHTSSSSSTKCPQIDAFYIPGHVEVYHPSVPETTLHTYAVYQVHLRD